MQVQAHKPSPQQIIPTLSAVAQGQEPFPIQEQLVFREYLPPAAILIQLGQAQLLSTVQPRKQFLHLQ